MIFSFPGWFTGSTFFGPFLFWTKHSFDGLIRFWKIKKNVSHFNCWSTWTMLAGPPLNTTFHDVWGIWWLGPTQPRGFLFGLMLSNCKCHLAKTNMVKLPCKSMVHRWSTRLWRHPFFASPGGEAFVGWSFGRLHDSKRFGLVFRTGLLTMIELPQSFARKLFQTVWTSVITCCPETFPPPPRTVSQDLWATSWDPGEAVVALKPNKKQLKATFKMMVNTA